MLQDLQVNLIGVLLASFASMVLGFLWYSPFLFGKAWMAYSGVGEAGVQEMKKKGMALAYGLAFVNGLVMNAVLGVLLNLVYVENLLDTILLSVMVWVGFVATVFVSGILWEKKKLQFVAINAGHYLVSIIVSGIIQYFFLGL